MLVSKGTVSGYNQKQIFSSGELKRIMEINRA
jgi:hypothetical protein